MKVLGVALLLLCAPLGAARAYPQFQLSTGAARCSQCHIAPSGGGVLSGYGRDEAGETISARGDGRFLHGLVTPPSWLFVGGDYRSAGLGNWAGDTESPRFHGFPMQADLYAAGQLGSFWVVATVGYVGQARSGDRSAVARVGSREHYLMWRPASQGSYLRLGRFAAPFGLRLVEHPVFVRKFEGFGPFEETYGISGGHVRNDWELHTTAFVPDPFRPALLRESGGAVLYERRLGDRTTLGAQARAGFGDTGERYTAGLIGKRWLEPILLLGQVDLSLAPVAGFTNKQMTAYLGATWFARRGLMVGTAVELYDKELMTPGTTQAAADLMGNWFPTAHLELVLWGRATNHEQQQLMLQLHYYL